RPRETLLALLLFTGVTNAQIAPEQAVEQALGSGAVHHTLVPHRLAIIPGSRAGRGTRSFTGQSPLQGNVMSTVFRGSPYVVEDTVIPTTTFPEAEEHIAVSPADFKFLVAMVMDFSLRGGFNTSKYVVSKDNGSTWTENFVPLSNGFPAT